MELRIPLEINAVGTAWLGDSDKEPIEGVSGMIAQCREYWRSR